MEVQGTIIKVLDMQSGTSKAGNQWCRQTFVIEYGDQHPQKLAISLMNAKAQEFGYLIQQGARVNVKCDVTSREFDNKWYTEAMAWKVESLMPQQQSFAPQQQSYSQPRQTPPFGQPYYPQQGGYQNNLFGQPGYAQNDQPPF